MLSGSRITTNDVVSAIASLQSRRGSRYTDIIKTLRSSGAEPSFTQVKAAMVKASEDGVVNQNSRGLWQLGSAKKNSTDSTVLQRRGRRKGGRSRRHGRHVVAERFEKVVAVRLEKVVAVKSVKNVVAEKGAEADDVIRTSIK